MESMMVNDVVACNDGARYRVTQELRSGGQGRTYLVCEQESGKEYVFKLLADRDPQRLRRKIENIRRLKDDAANLLRQLRTREFSVALPVSLYDKKGSFGYVMEKCSGKEINDLMLEKRFDRMPTEERIRLVTRIADAMDWFRRAGYCYQDISHKNVMYDASGTGSVSIIDCDNVSAERNVTQIVGGTSFFVAPEIAFEGCGHSILTDQYSLAVLLFKIMTGSADSPYHGKKLYSKYPKPADMFDAADLYQDDPSYGTDWLTFIFDPDDKSNRLDLEIFKNPADREKHRIVLDNWRSVPYEVKTLFYRAFRSPLDAATRKKRPHAGEWVQALTQSAKGAQTPPAPTPTPTPTTEQAPTAGGLQLKLYTDEKTFRTVSVEQSLPLYMASGKPFGTVEKQGEGYRFTSRCLYSVKYYAPSASGTLHMGESVSLCAGMQLYIPQRPKEKVVVS